MLLGKTKLVQGHVIASLVVPRGTFRILSIKIVQVNRAHTNGRLTIAVPSNFVGSLFILELHIVEVQIYWLVVKGMSQRAIASD